eukprot:GHVU01146787.1.p1 GENE.GHVU01146787.1~~GHVU01146787.1.p1  ORF type:complete len:468 (+),score=28.56 GHVU01146787.1:74-1405(+)
MSTTATDTLDIHAALLPMPLEIERHRHRAAARLITLPTTHPLAKYVSSAANAKDLRPHFSPLQELIHKFGLHPLHAEKREAVRFGAQWDPNLTITTDRRNAETERSKAGNAQSISCYTDGSGYKGGVGAAAVAYKDGAEYGTLQYYLGSEDDHEVYEAECVGMLLALQIVSNLPRRTVKQLTIWADNLAAILATDSPRPGPSHYILDSFHKALQRLRMQQPGINVTISWVPGHKGYQGNERADILAKEAASGYTSERSSLPTLLHRALPRNHTSTIRSFAKTLAQRHETEWSASPRSVRYKDIDEANASKTSRTFWKISRELPRRLSSILVQLRTGHIPLQKHLHRIQRANSDICPCCKLHPETVFHYLMMCPVHKGPRASLRRNFSNRDWNLSSLLNRPESLEHLARYINTTGRFQHVMGDLPEWKPIPTTHRTAETHSALP